MRITEHRRFARGLPDLLLYGSLVEDGVLLLQDGALMAGWSFLGPDLASATAEEMATLSGRLSSILRLGSGWMIQCDAVRSKTPEYARQGEFPDPVTYLIDAERREQFTREGSHFESEYFFTVTYLPPAITEEKLRGFMFVGGGPAAARPIAARALEFFKTRIESFEEVFSSQFKVRRLKGKRVESDGGFWGMQDELVRYVRRCVVGEDFPFAVPEVPAFLHDLIGCRDFIGGIAPEIGEYKIRMVAIDGFPHASCPGILAALDALPFEYRWNTRAILLDPVEASNIIEAEMKRWRGKTRGFIDQLFGRKGAINYDAVRMRDDAEAAMAEASGGDVQFAYYSSNVIVLEKDGAVADERAKQIVKTLENLGFAARIETTNALEAWRGSLPGDGYCNVRRILLHTLNLADCLPISAVWTGSRVNPCAYMPPDSPPLVYATSLGATPFRLHLHVGDLGHTVILGPPGSGKSTLLATLVAQWFRYPRAQVFCFDKGYSMQVLTWAAGGDFHDIAGPHSQLNFCPLGELETPQDLAWAVDWVEGLCTIAGMTIVPQQRNEIANAVRLLRESPERTLTELVINMQDEDLRDGLKHYTLKGTLGQLLEAPVSESYLGSARLCVFEMEHLIGLRDKAVVPVLLYLFRQIEKRLDGSPTLIVLDEAWVFLQHEMFAERIKEWLKTLRKLNAVVVFATQSISDVMHSAIRDVILEGCPTKILLPNAEAGNDESRQYYERMGLNRREIEIVKMSRPKQQYYVSSPDGKRLISLGLGPVALAFLGVSDKETRDKVTALRQRDPDGWVERWLRVRRLDGWADWYRNSAQKAFEEPSGALRV